MGPIYFRMLKYNYKSNLMSKLKETYRLEIYK